MGLLFAASCCPALAVDVIGRVDAFSKLKRGDIMVVRFHTSGCFHDATHEFTFRRGSDLTVSIAQLPRGPVAGILTTQTNRVGLGTLTLPQSDIAGLDKLMDFYRSRHNSFCTTVDDILFTQKRAGKTVAAEQIRDGSCQSYEMKHLTRFPDLIGCLGTRKR